MNDKPIFIPINLADREEILLGELINKAATCTKKKSLHCYITSRVPKTWRVLKQIVKPIQIPSVIRLEEARHILTFVYNEAEIRLIGTTELEKLQGMKIDRIAIDEFAKPQDIRHSQIVETRKRMD